MSMAPRDEGSRDGLDAAVRRFPAQGRQIEHLLHTSESFSALCADLAAAENALSAIDQVPLAVRSERRAEYEALTGGLAAEIEQALRNANIVSFKGARRHHQLPIPKG